MPRKLSLVLLAVTLLSAGCAGDDATPRDDMASAVTPVATSTGSGSALDQPASATSVNTASEDAPQATQDLGEVVLSTGATIRRAATYTLPDASSSLDAKDAEDVLDLVYEAVVNKDQEMTPNGVRDLVSLAGYDLLAGDWAVENLAMDWRNQAVFHLRALIEEGAEDFEYVLASDYEYSPEEMAYAFGVVLNGNPPEQYAPQASGSSASLGQQFALQAAQDRVDRTLNREPGVADPPISRAGLVEYLVGQNLELADAQWAAENVAADFNLMALDYGQRLLTGTQDWVGMTEEEVRTLILEEYPYIEAEELERTVATVDGVTPEELSAFLLAEGFTQEEADYAVASLMGMQ